MANLKEIRCSKCRRFLGKQDIKEGEVQLKCPNCKAWIIIVIEIVKHIAK